MLDERVVKFKAICTAYDARIWFNRHFEKNDLIHVNISDYPVYKIIREFAENLGFEFEDYNEHQDHICLTLHVGDIRDSFKYH